MQSIMQTNIIKDQNLYAAIDLGSNSFHMIMIHYDGQEIQVIDKHKEMIRLRSGLDKDGNLTELAFNKAMACLKKMGDLIKKVPASQVKAVGTSTLRSAKNSKLFLEKSYQALGHKIQIISGEEEAHLIYQGVSQDLLNNDKKRFVMDIGGGSTEYILGKNKHHHHLTSIEMGCVRMTQQFFGEGLITDKNMNKAIEHCRQLLHPHSHKLLAKGWEETIGASGSIKSIGKILQENELTQGEITLAGMLTICDKLIAAGSAELAVKQGLKGLKEERIPVFAGGLSVLIASFYELNIKSMQVSSSALREGLIYDMLEELNGIQK